MVYLPLRNGVTALEFGIPKGATIKAGPARPTGSKPMVFYGTSITHGIGASRAGMTHVAMLGRTFNREVINLGFSGNGRMEPEVLKFVAELDPAIFVLDCLPNVTERTIPGVKLLRDAHPDTPILLVEDRNMQTGFLVEARRKGNEANHAALRESFAALKEENVAQIYYLEGVNLLGDDGEGTVDGSHPTTWGSRGRRAINPRPNGASPEYPTPLFPDQLERPERYLYTTRFPTTQSPLSVDLTRRNTAGFPTSSFSESSCHVRPKSLVLNTVPSSVAIHKAWSA